MLVDESLLRACNIHVNEEMWKRYPEIASNLYEACAGKKKWHFSHI